MLREVTLQRLEKSLVSESNKRLKLNILYIFNRASDVLFSSKTDDDDLHLIAVINYMCNRNLV
jgi:hypothetical protein